ncbi:MAG: hypothetical protein CME01_06580 [Geminicoccus sp.]|nr:hypothetical protein [Geminicoccus sp.]
MCLEPQSAFARPSRPFRPRPLTRTAIPMIGWILARPLALMTGAVGGAAASQIPTFQTAYLNYLQGRVDEAARTADIAQQELTRASNALGVESVAALKALLAQGEDAATVALASSVAAWDALIERSVWLQAAISEMTGQVAFERLLKLPMSLRPEFVQGTMRNFEPGFAFTLESAVMVLSMALLAYFVARMIARLFWRLVRPNRSSAAGGQD